MSDLSVFSVQSRLSSSNTLTYVVGHIPWLFRSLFELYAFYSLVSWLRGHFPLYLVTRASGHKSLSSHVYLDDFYV